ncbi:DUF3710 domain-containing protein [Tersicoccus sp. MR15.9]|uniref:DUF3710 domain-containing protein n=1 Tax=Tersicoccus mangrovi TaxID=3121635 RepID=UPI002FE5409E
MIFGRSKKRGSSDLPMTSADPVETADPTAPGMDSTGTDDNVTDSTGTDSTGTNAAQAGVAAPQAAPAADATTDTTASADSAAADSDADNTPRSDTGATEPPAAGAAAPAPEAGTAQPAASSADVLDRVEHGPHDVAEITDREGYLDLGAILIKPVQGVMLRLEVQETTNRVLAAILDLGESSLQLQAFAAPRSAGLWDEIRAQIAEGVTAQSGQAHEVRTSFGTELLAAVPAVAGADAGLRVARFVGIDGPRWFLRGVITGSAATDDEQAAAIEALFRDVVVVRGTEAMAPRDLLTISIPGVEDAGTTPDGSTPDGPPERGPEVTQIG